MAAASRPDDGTYDVGPSRLAGIEPDVRWVRGAARGGRREVDVVRADARGLVIRTSTATGRTFTPTEDRRQTPRTRRDCTPGCTW